MRDALTPPLIAQALVAAAAPPDDYESIAGDLHEEYMRRVARRGVADANRWYWSQALASIPPLLSYSRVQRSVWNVLAIAGIALVALIALLLVTDFIDSVLHGACRGACPAWLMFSVDWIDAAVFGAMLALLVRTGGMRFVARYGRRRRALPNRSQRATAWSTSLSRAASAWRSANRRRRLPRSTE